MRSDGGQAGKVRIIGGKWRGKKIPIVGNQIRPTPDRVRETLFNWLNMSIPQSRCLDLFAGTGVLGLEALSRGASWVTFVEADMRSAQALKNISQDLFAEQSVVQHTQAMQFLKSPPSAPFDIIFLDPPYASDLLTQALSLLLTTGWCHSRTIIFFEHGKETALSLSPPWQKSKQQAAGEVCYGLITQSEEPT
jgi:16S rRNA (guanine966-N2)-methyltransferase